ncbi:MAG: hypothetical protein J0H92_20985 [Sphingobacteriales bacterium]|nr:hypothetical protein [Sphingobacteriales bacterium]OJW35521.1 MAG: hypothetical protein BGO54_04220 [Sphingobacteriales bacterium 46-32]
MISLRFRSTLSIALISFVLGCCAAFLLMARCGKEDKQANVAHAKLLKAQADSLHTHYQTAISELESQNKKLDRQLQTTQAELEAAKAKTKTKAAAIKQLLNPPGYPAKELLKKTGGSSTSFAENPEKCDSLVSLLADFMIETEIKENLYEVQALTQDSLIEGQQAVITLHQNENLQLSSLLKQSLAEQQSLVKDYIHLQKRMKRQRASGRWLAIGTAVLSGIATHYLTNR